MGRKLRNKRKLGSETISTHVGLLSWKSIRSVYKSYSQTNDVELLTTELERAKHALRQMTDSRKLSVSWTSAELSRYRCGANLFAGYDSHMFREKGLPTFGIRVKGRSNSSAKRSNSLGNSLGSGGAWMTWMHI